METIYSFDQIINKTWTVVTSGNLTVLQNDIYYFNFTEESGEYVMYIDGVAVVEEVSPFPSSWPSNPVGTTLIDNWDNLAYIGVWTSSGGGPFIGLMDDFVLYNYALSASDIGNLKTSGPGAVSVP